MKIKNNEIPVVGIGASAGGLDALKRFFSNVSDKSNIAYIVVIHLSPEEPSLMQELIQKVSSIPVKTAQDSELIEANKAYIIPAKKAITIKKNKIKLADIQKSEITHVIDIFLKSMAIEKSVYSAAIILSGTGCDGSAGIKKIKANDGLVIVQNISSAQYDGMIKSAKNTGYVDIELNPEEIPQKLQSYFNNIKSNKNSFENNLDLTSEILQKIFSILQTKIGYDFSIYKENTIVRRINRRMTLNQIESTNNYLGYLRKNPQEIESLFRELLIGVTSFFRDPEVFEIIQTKVLPNMVIYGRRTATFTI
jgi:two-component system CheB/CheR fusion protein